MAKETDTDSFSVSWQASEYVHHEKSPLWFVAFAAITLLVLAGTYVVLDHDLFSVIIIALMASSLAFFAVRKPKSLDYRVGDEGIEINHKQFLYKSFKSFSVMDYGAVESIYLDPLERFMPPISIYFTPDDGEKIVNILGNYLPHKNREPDLFDRLVHSIRL